MPENKCRYMVTWATGGGDRITFPRAQVTHPPIRGMEDTVNLERILRERLGDQSLVLISFSKFED